MTGVISRHFLQTGHSGCQQPATVCSSKCGKNIQVISCGALLNKKLQKTETNDIHESTLRSKSSTSLALFAFHAQIYLTFDINIPGSSTPNGWLVWSVPPTMLNPSGPPAFTIVIFWNGEYSTVSNKKGKRGGWTRPTGSEAGPHQCFVSGWWSLSFSWLNLLKSAKDLSWWMKTLLYYINIQCFAPKLVLLYSVHQGLSHCA